MANDPGITDQCIFINPGPPGTEWLSDDIHLTGPAPANLDGKADTGSNTVAITFHQKANCQVSPLAGVINLDVYLCDPTLGWRPDQSAKISNTAGRPTVVEAPPGPGADRTRSFTWTITAPPATPHEQPGHKCLRARVYPDNDTPSSTDFYYGDPHVAQRNICIVPCDANPGCSLEVRAANVLGDVAGVVRVTAQADLRPTQDIINIVMPPLEETPQFKRLGTQLPKDFAVRMPDFPDAPIRDFTQPSQLFRVLEAMGYQYVPEYRIQTMANPTLDRPVRGPAPGRLWVETRGGFNAFCDWLLQRVSYKYIPRYETEFVFKPEQLTTFPFTADLSASSPGDAHIFHLTQHGQDGQVQGGLTVVFVRT